MSRFVCFRKLCSIILLGVECLIKYDYFCHLTWLTLNPLQFPTLQLAAICLRKVVKNFHVSNTPSSVENEYEMIHMHACYKSYNKCSFALFTGYQKMKILFRWNGLSPKKMDESRPYGKMKNQTHVDNFRWPCPVNFNRTFHVRFPIWHFIKIHLSEDGALIVEQ